MLLRGGNVVCVICMLSDVYDEFLEFASVKRHKRPKILPGRSYDTRIQLKRSSHFRPECVVLSHAAGTKIILRR